MISSVTVDNSPLYKERKRDMIQNRFRIDLDHQILGVF